MGVRFIGPVVVRRGIVRVGVTYSQGFSTRSDVIEIPLAHLAGQETLEAINEFVQNSLLEAWERRQPPQEPLPLEKWE